MTTLNLILDEIISPTPTGLSRYAVELGGPKLRRIVAKLVLDAQFARKEGTPP